nr:15255_t:CDS:2 [Entrophospora candida]
MSSLQFQLSQKLLSDGGYFRELKRISFGTCITKWKMEFEKRYGNYGLQEFGLAVFSPLF